MSKPEEIDSVRREEEHRSGESAPKIPEDAADLPAFASLRPRHPFLKGPWGKKREADLTDILVVHSDVDD